MTQKRRKIQPRKPKFNNVDAVLYGDYNDNNATVILLDNISLPKSQPRKYFSDAAMKELEVSIRKDGILQPLLVRPLENGKYELVAGERRYRAAKEIGLTEVPIFSKQMTEKEANKFALTENLQREDLNPVEETEAILDLLAIEVDGNRQDVISLLNTRARKMRGGKVNSDADNDVRTRKIQIIEDFFQHLGKYNAEAFRTHRLPLLNLPSHILEVLKKGDIAYTKAKLIAKIQDLEIQKQILKEAIDQSLTLTQIKAKIKSLKPSEEQDSLLDRFNIAYKKVCKKKQLWQEQKKQKKLESLLKQLEKLLED